MNGLAARRTHHPKVESSYLAQPESGAWLEHRIHNPMLVRVIHTLSFRPRFCGKSIGSLRVAIPPERRIFADVNNGAYQENFLEGLDAQASTLIFLSVLITALMR